MADPAWAPSVAQSVRTTARRHSALVRVTHWITTVCFFALLVSGLEIVVSHPRFYWGEVGNVRMPALFEIPIPASRPWVSTGYDFVLPDQNGWSRSLHFEAAWILVLTGLLYAISGLFTHHFRTNLLPARTDLTGSAISRAIADHLRPPAPADAASYNLLQRLAYLCVIFFVFPMMIWTGLAMSPAVTSAFPFLVAVLGGHQSARTLHFFLTISLVLFVVVHVVMVYRAGFWNRVRAMITGHHASPKEVA